VNEHKANKKDIQTNNTELLCDVSVGKGRFRVFRTLLPRLFGAGSEPGEVVVPGT
jgi:hypothetical protein